MAGVNATETAAAILISNFARTEPSFRGGVTNIPWAGPTIVETRLVSATRSFDQVVRETNATSSFTVTLELKNPAVALIRLRPVRE